LPSKWVEANSIKAGDEIDVDHKDKKCLKISTASTKTRNSIEIDVSGIDHNAIRQKLRSTYKLGYEELLLTFDKNIVTELRTEKEFPIMQLINHEVSNLIGCEVIKQSNNSCVIRDYAIDSELEFNNTLRRVFILMNDYGRSLLEQAKTGDKLSLQGMRERHFNIAKFIFYCQRLINKGSVVDNNRETFLYYIVSELDEILDIMKYAAADLIKFKGKLKKETIHLFSKIIEHNKDFENFYYKPNNTNLMTLTENRWYARKQLKELINRLPKDELYILINMSYILELYYHLSEARMSLDCKN